MNNKVLNTPLSPNNSDLTTFKQTEKIEMKHNISLSKDIVHHDGKDAKIHIPKNIDCHSYLLKNDETSGKNVLSIINEFECSICNQLVNLCSNHGHWNHTTSNEDISTTKADIMSSYKDSIYNELSSIKCVSPLILNNENCSCLSAEQLIKEIYYSDLFNPCYSGNKILPSADNFIENK